LDLTFPVHEVFGPTIQGEGHWAGRLVSFIRLFGCPVRCPWCDTGYSDGGKGLPRPSSVPIPELIEQVRAMGVGAVVISGGEPFIHPELGVLVQALGEQGLAVSIETSGAAGHPLPKELGAWITLSPKTHVSPRYPVQAGFWEAASEVKLVVDDGSEPLYYQEQLRQFQGPVFLQPQWENRAESLRAVLGLLQDHPSWRLSLQQHKLVGLP
jgi:organic radical activating enzyme